MNGGEVIFKFKGDTQDLDDKTKGIASKLGNLGKSIGGAFAKGGAVVGTALTGMVAASVKSYADVEQSIGGIETLFKDSASTVIENANKAFKTAGIDANTYMEQVTSVSASLLQSLHGDTAKAAKVADTAIIDMADNANKMGTPLESIQAAYQGFAKEQYMLLDNLHLGYGGTKTEMERLLKDAQKISGVKYDIKNLNDVYSAIHVIQEDLGIAGATGEEAMSTISGSVQSAKASFQNFLSGQGSIDDVVTTFITAGTNIGNAIVKMAPQVVDGIVKLVNGLIPEIPKVIKLLLPTVLSGVIEITRGIINALPQIISILSGMLPEILDGLLEGLLVITYALADQMPVLIPQIVEAILEIIPMLIEYLPLFLKAGFQIVGGIIQGIIQSIPILIDKLPQIGNAIINYIKQLPSILLEIGKNLVHSIWDGMQEAFPFWSEGFKLMLDEIKEPLSFWIEGFKLMINGLVDFFIKIKDALVFWAEGVKLMIDGIVSFFIKIKDAFAFWIEGFKLMIDGIVNIFNGVINFVKNNWQGLLLLLVNPIVGAFKLLYNNCEGFRNFINGFVGSIVSTFKNIVGSIVSVFNGIKDKMFNIGKDMINGLINGVKNMVSGAVDTVKNVGKSILGGIKGVLGIHSPSKEFASIGEFSIMGYEKGLQDMQPELQNELNSMFDLSPNLYGTSSTNLSPNVNVVVNSNTRQDPLGRMVNDIKTFSNGAKNDYNYGM